MQEALEGRREVAVGEGDGAEEVEAGSGGPRAARERACAEGGGVRVEEVDDVVGELVRDAGHGGETFVTE